MKFHRINALILKYYYITYKTLDRLSDIFFWPVMALFLWGFMSLFIEQYNVNLLGLIVAGVVFYHYFQRFQTDIPLYLLEGFWQNTMQNTFSTPITKWEKLVSLIIFALLKGILVLIITALAAWIFFGYSILNIPLHFIFISMFSLGLFSIGLGIFLAGMIFRFGTNVQMIAWSTPFLLQPFMAVFYPVSILPYSLQIIAKLIPASYVFEGLRLYRESGVFHWQGFWISIVLNIIYIIIACFVYNWAFEHNKRNGRLVHTE